MVVEDHTAASLPVSSPTSDSSVSHDVNNLHDCVALGALEYGLPYLQIRSSAEVDAKTNHPHTPQDDASRISSIVLRTDDNIVHTEAPSEIHRLPLLLRLLSQSRPLSSIRSWEEIQPKDVAEGDVNDHDPLLEDIVARLEDRAAIYAAAESVQVVACHLAPAACWRISKLSSLPKKKTKKHPNVDISSSYDTTELELLSQNLLHSPVTGSKKQRRLSLTKQGAQDDVEEDHSEFDGDEDDDLHGRKDEPDSEHDWKAETSTSTSTSHVNKKRRRPMGNIDTRALSFSNASEDSPEYIVLKTLHELVSLTVASLQQDDGYEKMIKKDDTKNVRTSMAQENETKCTYGLPLSKMDDSILAQPARLDKSIRSGSNSMVTSSFVDLASTVVALMHHAPVLQHRHVASALCRAALPQTPVLIARMGANCPAAVPCLLDECINVYVRAVIAALAVRQQFLGSDNGGSHQLSNIAAACVQSVRLLAQLSPREAHRTLAALRRKRYPTSLDDNSVMVELQLELMMQHDTLAAFLFITRQLSVTATSTVPEGGPFDDVKPITTLCDHLHQNVPLLRDVLNFLYNHLSAESLPIIRLSIVLSAFIKIISQVPMNQVFAVEGPGVLLRSLVALREKLMLLRDNVVRGRTQPETISVRQAYDLIVASMISTYAILLSEDEFRESVNGAQLKDLLDMQSAPSQSHVLLGRLSLSLFYADEYSLYDIVDSTIILFDPKNSTSMTSKRDDRFLSFLKELCTWSTSSTLLDVKHIEYDLYSATDPTLLRSSVALQLLKYEQSTSSVANKLLERVLVDSHIAVLFIQEPLAVEFIERASSIGLRNQETNIPLVRPIQIQQLTSTILWWHWEDLEIPVLQFLMQLLYCFYFFELEPNSPFRIDPRELPLNRVLELGERLKTTDIIDSSVILKLDYFIDKFCPEVRRFHRFKMLKSRERLFQKNRPTLLVKKNTQEFMGILRQAVAVEPQFDPSGLLAERAFIEASFCLSDADLISTTVSALVSSPSSPAVFFTYPMLYRDPLNVLKCPLTVWSRRGTRRIALAVLTNLLTTHECVIHKVSGCQDIVSELLASRNEIILRCLLRVVTLPSSKLDGSFLHCGQTYGLIRKLVATHEGLAALLIKQGLSETELDWLTESVPEMAMDFPAIHNMLTDKSSLSAAKRLVVADCSLRIAIAHGHRSDGYAEAIAHACLSQLISSFFLILGPMGIPVNALAGEGTDLDATQVSRKATFRLLTSLQKIRSFRTRLKTESVAMLQKFLGMCKGEAIVGSLTTAISGRQKSFLKDLVEVVGKAMESMGSVSNLKD